MAGANAIAGPAGRPTPVPDQRPAPSPAGRAARGHGPWPAGPGVRACRGGAHPGPPARSPTPSPTANRTGWCATPATLSRSPPTRQPGCGRWRSAMCWLPATRLAPRPPGSAGHQRPPGCRPSRLPRLLSMVWGPTYAHDRMAAMSAEDYRPAGDIAPACRGTAVVFWCDPYRMSISLSTAAASRIARRSAPSGVRYRFRRPAS
jgi:hypothetical protein